MGSDVYKKDHQLFVGAVKRLESLGNVISAALKSTERWVLTPEGQTMASNGSYEAVLFNLVPAEGLKQSELANTSLGEKNAQLGFKKAMAEGWLAMDKTAEGGPWVVRKVDSIVDNVQNILKSVERGDKVDDVKKVLQRKLVKKEVIKSYTVTKGEGFTLTIEKPEADLTSEMLANGAWKTKKFKDYNFDALGHLIGILYAFFKKLGMEKLRFKPAYNPYTEPSMEIFSYHEGLGKWIEIGNSGIFRPEMLLPMGLPKNVNVIAWGLSLERPTMIKYGISNIRDLIGHKIDLSLVYESPICRLDESEGVQETTQEKS